MRSLRSAICKIDCIYVVLKGDSSVRLTADRKCQHEGLFLLEQSGKLPMLEGGRPVDEQEQETGRRGMDEARGWPER